jgi:hypothetical protein
MGIHSTGKALLRWAPADFNSWQQGVTQGYRLERYTLLSNGTNLSTAEVLASRQVLSRRLLPQSEATFVAMSDTSNAAGVAGAALYEDTIRVSVGTGDPFIRALSIAEQNDSRYGLGLFAADASFGVARAMALGYIDASLPANSVYEYRIAFYQATDSSMTTGAWRIQLDTRLNQTLPLPPAPTMEAGVNGVLLNWSKQGLESYYTGYDIERSADNGNTWQKRNQLPILPSELDQSANPDVVYYTDTLESESITYFYRLRGHSIFGIKTSGLVAATQSLPPPLAENPLLTELVQETGVRLLLKWSFPSGLNSQIKGFRVYRSPLVEGPFVALGALLTASTRQYIDPSPWHTNYYLVKAIDLHDREWSSLALLGQPEDNVAPTQVSGIAGKIDATGLTRLNWNANPEDDLRGYRIYQADALDGEYIQINGETVLSNSFSVQIPMNTTAEEVYFKVRAVDFRENLGALSAPLRLQRPDIIPPAPPNLAELELTLTGVKAKWAPSVSPDVVRHEVQRRSIVQTEWTSIANLESALEGDQITLDTTLRDAVDWEYRVVATDETGLSSFTNPMKISMPQVKRPEVTQLKAETSIAEGRIVIKLSWEYPQDPLLHRFVIYRSENGGPAREHAQLDLETFVALAKVEQSRDYFAWRDTEANPGKTYHYQVIAKFLDGSASKKSATVNKSF